MTALVHNPSTCCEEPACWKLTACNNDGTLNHSVWFYVWDTLRGWEGEVVVLSPPDIEGWRVDCPDAYYVEQGESCPDPNEPENWCDPPEFPCNGKFVDISERDVCGICDDCGDYALKWWGTEDPLALPMIPCCNYFDCDTTPTTLLLQFGQITQDPDGCDCWWTAFSNTSHELVHLSPFVGGACNWFKTVTLDLGPECGGEREYTLRVVLPQTFGVAAYGLPDDHKYIEVELFTSPGTTLLWFMEIPGSPPEGDPIWYRFGDGRAILSGSTTQGFLAFPAGVPTNCIVDPVTLTPLD